MKPTKEQIKERIAHAVIPVDPQIPLDEFQTAKLINRSVHSLRRDRWAGDGIKFLKLHGSVRYTRNSIDQYIQSHLRISTSDPGKNAAQDAICAAP